MTTEKATTDPKEYSRAEITALNKRKEAADAIRQKNGGKDLTKTTEGKSQLSNEWMNKAGISGKQKERVLKELNINPKDNPDEKAQKISEWQEKNKLAGKDGKGDGILGWATLEALDKAIEEQDEKYDTNADNSSDHGGALENGNTVNPDKLKYGLDRVAYHEKNGKTKDEFTEQNTKKPESTAVKKENVVKEPTQQEDRIDAIRWRYKENPKQAEGAIAKLYTEKPDDFILDKTTDGLPIVQNAEGKSKEEMTALIRGLQIQVPKGTYYQKTSDGWIKHENNIQYMAKEGKFGPQSTLAQNK